jgi:hypothetical protein
MMITNRRSHASEHRISTYHQQGCASGFALTLHLIRSLNLRILCRRQKILLRLWQHLVNKPYHLLTIPGNIFYATPDVEKKFDTKKTAFLRVTYVAVEVRELKIGGEAFAKGVKTFWEGEGWEESNTEDDEDEHEDEYDSAKHYQVRKVVKRYLNARGVVNC